MKLIKDEQLRERLIFNAGKVAQMHDISKVSSDFMEELGVIGA